MRKAQKIALIYFVIGNIFCICVTFLIVSFIPYPEYKSKPELFKVTYYTLSKADCGKLPEHPAYGITASGLKARFGVCAVDPSYIPINSYVIDFENQVCYIACDTGKDVKGNHIDIFIGEKGQWKDNLVRPINYGYFTIIKPIKK